MRRLFLSASFLLLIAGLVALWRVRFERVPDTPPLSLADLRNAVPVLPTGAVWQGSKERPTLRLTVGGEIPRVGVRMDLPGFPAMEALHLRVCMTSKDLRLGRQNWDDGRTLIEWKAPDGGGSQETDPVCSLRGTDSTGELSLVVRASSGSAIPVLRVEHLGSSGEFEISKLEMIPVRERALWRSGSWVILAAFVAWLWALLSGADRRPVWRRILAVIICLGICVYFAIPGPWKTLRPLLMGFDTGPSVKSAEPAAPPVRDSGTTRTPPPAASEMLGKIPPQGGWIIQAKHQLAMARPLLHAMLLFAPTLALAWLLGRRQALALAVGLAVSIEAAQTAFGFGFDWVDAFDLATDAVGIAVAMWLHGKLPKC